MKEAAYSHHTHTTSPVTIDFCLHNIKCPPQWMKEADTHHTHIHIDTHTTSPATIDFCLHIIKCPPQWMKEAAYSHHTHTTSPAL